MKKQNKKKALTIIGIAGSIGAASLGFISANTGNNDIRSTYEIYPNPHTISYDGKQSLISTSVNVVVEDDVDQVTITRFKEALTLRGITNINFSRRIVDDQTNFILGIKGNRDTFVDDYISSENISYEPDLMNKIDAYVLSVKDNVIAIYGNEADSTFYGATTLWHILNQLEGLEIENIKIQDYADVKTRGAIEGYYGNPWTVQDRINYMSWGGYYKLNAYFYAPKDDPKHNSKWAELYTDDEIQNLIRPIAEAGNNSKVRFIYALHPFMHNRLDNGNVADKKEKLKAKFLQVIEAGVRQISILADDAAKPNEQFQIDLLTEMVDWLKELKATRFPDLKTTLPYVVQEYMGWGQEYFKRFPSEVQIVMTGGTIWGQVTKNFTDSFTNKIGEGPMLWINWPCTDNSKEHLIMGGFKEFLKPDVNPKNVEGIILNPMQQSEPSKVALFGNAVYSWNLWKTNEQADKAWNDAFKHVDNKSSIETPTSKAFRELSKHMINQKMDGRVVKLEESLELKPYLYDLINKLSTKTYSKEELTKLTDEFTLLNESAKIFLENGNDRNLVEQMRPFLESWVDLTDSALIYLEILEHILNDNITSVNNLYQQAKNKLILARNNHKFRYLSEMKNAEVGPQHIQPFLDELDSFSSKYLKENLDDNFVSLTWISDVFTTPSSGNKDEVFNQTSPKAMQFKNPLYIMKDNYIGVEFSKEIELNNVFISMGGGKNHFYKSKLQYKSINGDWTDVNNNVYERPNGSIIPIEEYNLSIPNVKALRLVSLQNDIDDKWLVINSFIVNKPLTKKAETSDNKLTFSSVELNGLQVAGGELDKITDDSENTEAHLRSSEQPKYDGIRPNNSIVFNFDEVTEVAKFVFVQGSSNSGDVLKSGVVEYYDSNTSTWKQFGSGSLDSQKKQIIIGYAQTNKIRVRNLEDKKVWWRVGGAFAYGFDEKLDINYKTETENIMIGKNPAINDGARNNKFDHLYDNNPSTIAWMAGKDNGNIGNNSKLIINFDKSMRIDEILIRQGDGDNLRQILVEAYTNGTWVELNRNTNAAREYTIDTRNKEEHFSKLRISSLVNTNIWWKLADVKITERKRASNEYVIVGSKDNSVLSLKNQNNFTLLNKSNKNISLAKDQYIGLDLKSIKKIQSFTQNTLELNNAQIQISVNGIAWENITSLEQVKNKVLRYIRIVNNNSESEINVNFDNFTLTAAKTNEFGELVKTTLPEGNSGWGDTRYNKAAFDGKMNTSTKFGVSPTLGKEIIYDLGKEIDIHKLRIYAPDSTSDFPRSIDVMYGTELNGEYQTLFSIGHEENRNINLIDVQNNYSYVDSKYPNVRFFGNIDNLETPVKARYIKLLIIKNYPNRALIISEIQINDGQYISLDNDPRFNGAEETEKNTLASKMIDGDFLTYYEPKISNSSITFFNDDPQPNKFVKFITSSENSDANVEVKTADSNGDIHQITLGKLSFNNIGFRVPSGHSILELKVSWTETKPKINEVIFFNSNETEELNKDELNALISTLPEDFDLWVKSNKDAYNETVEIAKKILTFENITQATINEIKQSLNSIIQNKKLKGDFSKLIEELNNEITNFEDYLASTTSEYKLAISKAKNLIKSEEVTQRSIDSSLNQIISAKTVLRYSPVNKDTLQIKVNEFEKLDKSRFSEETYNLLKDKVLQAKQTISDDNAITENSQKIHPSVFKNLLDEYNNLYQDLVDSEKGVRYKEYLKIRDLAYKFIDENGSNWQILSRNLNAKVTEKDIEVKSESSTVEIIDQAIVELTNLIAENQRIKSNKIAKIKEYANGVVLNENSVYTTESYNDYKQYADKLIDLSSDSRKIYEEELDELFSNYIQAKNNLSFNDSVDLEEIKQALLSLVQTLDENEEYIAKIQNSSDATALKALSNEIDLKIEEQNTRKIETKRQEANNLLVELSKENNDLTNNLTYELNSSTDLESLESVILKIKEELNQIKSTLVEELKNELAGLENSELKQKVNLSISNVEQVSIEQLRNFIREVVNEKENELIKKITKFKVENNDLISQLEENVESYLAKLKSATTLEELTNLNSELKPIIQNLISKYKKIAFEKLYELENKENYSSLIESSENVSQLKNLISEIQDKISNEKTTKKVDELTARINELEDPKLVSDLLKELNNINDIADYDIFAEKVEQKVVELIENLKQKAIEILEKLENKDNLSAEQIQQIKVLKEIRELLSKLEVKLEEQNNILQEKLNSKKQELLNKINNYSELQSYTENINNSLTIEELNIIEQQIDLKINALIEAKINNNKIWINANVSLLNRDFELLKNQEIQDELINILNEKIKELQNLNPLEISESEKERENSKVSELLVKTNNLLKSNLVSLPTYELPLNKEIIKNNINTITNLLANNNSVSDLNVEDKETIQNSISNLDYSLELKDLIDKQIEIIKQYDDLWLKAKKAQLQNDFEQLNNLKHQIDKLIVDNKLTENVQIHELMAKINLTPNNSSILELTTLKNQQKELINKINELIENNKADSEQTPEKNETKSSKSPILIAISAILLVIIASASVFSFLKFKKHKKK